MATRRSLVSCTARAHTTSARTPANRALETKKTGMIETSAADATMAPWKSANQWYVSGSPATYGTSGGKLPWMMLVPIETWTRKSLQFQPPEIQPPGVSRQPLLPRTTRTIRPDRGCDEPGRRVLAERGSDRARARLAVTAARAARATDGAAARPASVPTMRSAVPTRTAIGPNPPIRLTRSIRWAERYVLATTATPTAPGRGRSGATRRTMTQPGTANSHGHTTMTPSEWHQPRRDERRDDDHDARDDPRRRQRLDPEAVVGGGVHEGR